MFSPEHDQAAGLRAVMSQDAPLLLPVALSRQVNVAAGFCGALADALSHLGHSVILIDASLPDGEADANGLAHRLRHGPIRGGLNHDEHPDEDWAIWPAQQGLKQLLQMATDGRPTKALVRLGELVAPEHVVMLLAPKEWLALLLEGSDARPLVPLTFEPSSVVDAYSSAKVLAQVGGLNPIWLPMAGWVPAPVERQTLQALTETAAAHLGEAPQVWSVPEDLGCDMTPAQHAWVLRMLETSLRLVPDELGYATSTGVMPVPDHPVSPMPERPLLYQPWSR